MEMPSTMNDCTDLQLYADPPEHAIVQPALESYQDTRSTLRTEHVISERVDTVTDRRDNKIVNTVKADLYKHNKVIKRYVTRRHSVKRSAREGCTLRSTVVNKCVVKDKFVRLSTVKTDIITGDVVRSYTVVEKSVRTTTVKNDRRTSSTAALHVRDAGPFVPPLLRYRRHIRPR